MQRFYVDIEKLTENIYHIKDVDMFHQLVKVMRAKVWDKVVLFNDKNNLDYIYEIKEIKRNEILLVFINKIEKYFEEGLELVLYQSITNKIEKIEYILQKWVEVWFKRFVFFRSKRSQKLDFFENKIKRLKKIIIEAVEQSNRNIVPEIIFEENIEFNMKWNNLFFHTEDSDSKKLKDLKLDYLQPINIFVWPEGGFDDKEIDIFEKNKFQKIYLWNSILRTETVWIVVWFYIVQMK